MLFGGHNLTYSHESWVQTWLADTWIYSGSSWTAVRVPGPSPREGGQTTYDARDGYVLLFGGLSCGPGTLTSN